MVIRYVVFVVGQVNPYHSRVDELELYSHAMTHPYHLIFCNAYDVLYHIIISTLIISQISYRLLVGRQMHYFMRESVRTVQCVMMGRRRVMNLLGLDISFHGHNHLLKIKLHLCIHEM